MPCPLAFGAEAWRSVDHDHGFSVKNLPLVACQPNPPKRGGWDGWGLCQEAIVATRDFQGDPLHTHSHLHESFGHAEIGDLAET